MNLFFVLSQLRFHAKPQLTAEAFEGGVARVNRLMFLQRSFLFEAFIAVQTFEGFFLLFDRFYGDDFDDFARPRVSSQDVLGRITSAAFATYERSLAGVNSLVSPQTARAAKTRLAIFTFEITGFIVSDLVLSQITRAITSIFAHFTFVTLINVIAIPFLTILFLSLCVFLRRRR